MQMIEKVELVPNGIKVSEMVQGYYRMTDWGVDTQSLLSFIKRHMELGITTVDHAHIYGNPACESVFGEAVKAQPSILNEMEIVTKFGIVSAKESSTGTAHYNSSKTAMIDSVELSLKRLNAEKIDVLLIHRPDLLLNADELAETYLTLKAQGKVLNLGVSNFTVSQFNTLQSRLDEPLVTNQIEINPVNLWSLEDGTLDAAQEKRMRPMAWSIMAGGRLFNENDEKNQRLRAVLNDIKSEISANSIDQVVYAWVKKLPSKPVFVLGSGKVARLETAVSAMQYDLSHEQWYRIWTASKGHGVA